MNYMIYQLMIKLICVLLLIHGVCSQSSLLWMPPSDLQVSRKTLILQIPLGTSTRYTPIIFTTPISATPSILLSLTSLSSIQDNTSPQIFQQVFSITKTSFTHKLDMTDSSHSISVLRIAYAAMSLDKFDFFAPYPLLIEYGNMDFSEFSQVDFLTPINLDTHAFKIGCFLTGFKLSIGEQTAPMKLGVTAELFSNESYFIRVICQEAVIKKLQVTRYLINQTKMQEQPVGIHQLSILTGYVQHYSMFSSQYVESKEVFFEQAFMFGVLDFDDGKFDCSYDRVYVRNGRDLRIGFLVFQEMLCSDTEPYYDENTRTCSRNCEVKQYAVSGSDQCASCHYSCYRCSGSTASDCLQCLRESTLTDGMCVCNLGFFDSPSAMECQLCSQAIPGCATCQSASLCESCLQNCILASPTYCSCPAAQCAIANEYQCPHTAVCKCLPQYYRHTNGSCQRCDEGCFICFGSSSNCSECMDRYQLVGSSCLYFYSISYLINSDPGYISEGSRCMFKEYYECIVSCDSSNMLYQSRCYPSDCPSSTFIISDTQAHMMCHPCPPPCVECSVYYVCRKCQQFGYYLTPTGLCQTCGDGCTSCTGSNQCNTCAQGYVMDANHTCYEDLPVLTQIDEIQCMEGCDFCVIEEICEKCKPQYFLLFSNYTCILCTSLPSIRMSSTPTLSALGVAAYYCEQICGDGLMVNAECDDGNTISNDGCSSSCQIETGYRCEYLDESSRSVCVHDGYWIVIEVGSLQANEIVVRIEGDGVLAGYLHYDIQCYDGNREVQFGVIKRKQVSPSIVQYTLQIKGESLQSKNCTFSVPNSYYIAPEIRTIESSPAALSQPSNNIYFKINTFIQSLLNYSIKPLAFFLMVLCLFGIDPFDIWINLSFLIMFVVGLEEKKNWPPSLYRIYDELKCLTMDLGLFEEEEKYVAESRNILVLFGVVLIWHEVFGRIMKSRILCPKSICQPFTYIFHNRILLYISVILSYLPASIFYTWNILSQDSKLGLWFSIAHISIATLALILLATQSQRMTKLRSMRKFIFLYLSGVWMGIFTSLGKIFSESLQLYMFTSDICIVTTFFSVIIALADSYPQKMTLLPHEEQARESSSSSFSSSRSRARGRERDRENWDDSSSTWENRKTTMRKVNISVQCFCFIVIYALRYAYFSEGQFSSAHQFLGASILCIFVFGNLYIGIILGIISECFTLAIYLTSQSAWEIISDASIHPEPNQEEQQERNDGEESESFSDILVHI